MVEMDVETEVHRRDTFRAQWLRALRGELLLDGEPYEQGIGQLVVARKDSQGAPQHCCIGVACSITGKVSEVRSVETMDAAIFPDIYDMSESYDRFCSIFEVSPRVQEHLIAMNDNSEIDENKFKRRATAGVRSFKFIARYMEIIWALEDMKV